MNMNRLLWTGLIGSAVTGVCCFTPLLTGMLGIAGLGAVTRYLDYALLPALAGFLGLTVYGLLGRNRKGKPGCCGDVQSHQMEEKP
jgi:mercuric ion transport protein